MKRPPGCRHVVMPGSIFCMSADPRDNGIPPWGPAMIPLLAARKIFLRKADTAEIIRKGSLPNRLVRLLVHGLKNLETWFALLMPFGTSINCLWPTTHVTGCI